MLNEISKKDCPVESLRRGLELLDLLCGCGEAGCGLADLSNRVGLKRTTVHNLLKTLVYSGYVSNLGDGHYGVGWRIRRLSDFELLNQIPGHRMENLSSMMQALTKEINEALILTVCVNGHRRIVTRTSAGHSVEVNVDAIYHGHRPLWTLETWLVMAAFASEEEFAQIRAANDWPTDPATATKLLFQLDEIRRAGYASLPNPSIYACAVPVLSENGELLAALGLNQPLYRHHARETRRMIEQLQQGAALLAQHWNE